jgi:hypothetical protein
MYLKKNDLGESVIRLQEWLLFCMPDVFQYWGEPIAKMGEFCENTDAILKEYQQKKGLVADGIFGEKSFQALRTDIQKLTNWADAPRGSKISCPVTKYQKGYGDFRLRTDAAYWFNKVSEACAAAGAIITSSGADRVLTADVSANRSPTSMHYIATAFDLYVYSAMVNPETDPFVVEKDGDYWRVWARAKTGVLRTIANPITYKQPLGSKRAVSGVFVDFTAICEENHFKRIKPRQSFFKGGNDMGAEWWHFQNEFVLFPNFSTLGQELLELYSADKINRSPVAKYKSATFKKDWF